ncbi:MAG: periplasmic heavy metal sensor [Desulfobaccales bacterium]|nr:periplasmic heavy metal sensor [Desulfobaccales bacterium]
MKRNWLLYLVIFSLALNVGTIGTLVYLRYFDQQLAAPPEGQPPLPLRQLWGALNMDPDQRQALRGLLPEHRRRVMDVRGQLAQKRQELFDLVKGEAPPWSAIQAKIQEISALQGGLEEEMVRFLLEVKKHLRPEQQAAFADLVQQRLVKPWGGRGGPPGPPHGWGRGMGPGPMGPGPHGPMGPPAESPK